MLASLCLSQPAIAGPGPGSEAAAATAGATRLASPFGLLAIKAATGAGFSRCPDPPTPYTDELEFPSKYEGSGQSRDTLNPEAEARYKLATRSIQAFESGLSDLSDRYVGGQASAAPCALSWLDAWARASALTGAANMTGRAVRKWSLSAAAFNYLKVRDASGLDPEQLRHVQDWMKRVAGIVIQEHLNLPPQKINNHYYWAAAAVGAAGIATNDRTLLDWAFDSYRRSVRDIDQDGVLPREMARRTRALSYHLFALQPLVMLAEMGRVNGVDLYAVGDCAICRLIRRVADGVQDPAFFEARTGARQDMEDGPDGRAMIWVAILGRACPSDPRLQALKAHFGPFSGRRLGGNLTDVYDHTSKELPNAIKTEACSHLWR